MSQPSDIPTPPYFNISPEAALADLEDGMGTGDFAAIAEACARGRDDLRAQGHAPDGRKTLRRFSTWEITRYLIPVAQAHFRRVLRAHPDLPQGRSETEAGAKWFTLEEVLAPARPFSPPKASRTEEYAPWRPEGLPAKICAIANFKGGVGKTSTAAHLAMSAALDGYRVLVIDLDSQGSMTSCSAARSPMNGRPVFPLIATRLRLGVARREPGPRRGSARPTLIARRDAERRTRHRSTELIQPTHWPNIDLIGAQFNLYSAEHSRFRSGALAVGLEARDELRNPRRDDGDLEPLRRGLSG